MWMAAARARHATSAVVRHRAATSLSGTLTIARGGEAGRDGESPAEQQ